MPYKGTSKIVAQVSINCENCGNSFSYNHTLSGNAQKTDEFAAIAMARERLKKQIDRINSGDFNLIAEHKVCPKCGYVQSWMILPIRKRRGMNWGSALGVATYLLVFPLMLLLENTPLHQDYMVPILFCGLPVAIFFIVRAIAMFLYQPNRGKEIPSQTKVPNIKFKSPIDVDGSEWKCPKCGGTNPVKRKTCLGCNTPNLQ
jgi:predicted RNA-binding Zn-ribbon protein involved in translation (DUF1610 family)